MTSAGMSHPPARQLWRAAGLSEETRGKQAWGRGGLLGARGVARQEHSMTRWKGAPHNPRLLKTARLGTGKGRGTDSWLGRRGHCRQLDTGFPTAFPRAVGAARGREAEEKACPSAA